MLLDNTDYWDSVLVEIEIITVKLAYEFVILINCTRLCILCNVSVRDKIIAEVFVFYVKPIVFGHLILVKILTH